jgi:hypothetical protein
MLRVLSGRIGFNFVAGQEASLTAMGTFLVMRTVDGIDQEDVTGSPFVAASGLIDTGKLSVGSMVRNDHS